MPGAPITRLSMVYDADGTLVGEVRYVVGHLLGRARCDLCDITHGGLRRRASFDDLIASLPVPADVVHRDEQSPELAVFTAGRLACVVGHTGDGLEVLVGREDLAACEGSVDRLADVLRPRLAHRT
ncbi:hypothetical protein HC251_01775 [Iamia sp. SCSIO 61187]|uniref:hypothetical protein n=1 Tax=Iamia sp. SCSIO 61187 TaxID=2722752 RepID=UPI001C627274|nr:hypothetical protein [Iamia sp. SCSIO 61187]QYG91289.1 hypothetical protein HC251_01775 [Iamia sp. SCSIO 61187]